MTTIQQLRLSLNLRALFGVLAIIVFAFLSIVYPVEVFHWMRDHKILDAVIAAIAASFHIWNTYQNKIVVP